MAVEVETRTGECSSHGTVEATREIPRPFFPFIVYAVRRYMSKRQPFRCPTCNEEVATS